MTKQNKKKTNHIDIFSRGGTLVLALLTFLSVSLASFSLVLADQFDAKIRALSEKNSNISDQKDQLGDQAADLNGVIAKLQNQIDTKQRLIAQHQAEVVKLRKEIHAAEIELAKQKKLLAQAIRAIYIEGDVTTLEMLASSEDLSDFFDQQQYRDSVQDKVKETLDKITQLKLDLNSRKEKTEKLIAEQKELKANLLKQQNEKNHLLSLNKNQQNQLNTQLKANNARIAKLRQEQAAANARLFGGVQVVAGNNGHDSYPNAWRNAAQDTMLDNWGMYNRECVSYAAWKVYESGRHMPYWGGRGNANQWDENAQSDGIAVDGNPRAGDVAISNSGYYGHAMYVESVNGNGTVNVSQYNWGLDGTYSEAYNLPAAGLVFIHFR